MRTQIPSEVEGRLASALQERLDDLSARIEGLLREARSGTGSLGETLSRALGEALAAAPVPGAADSNVAVARPASPVALAAFAALVQTESEQSRLVGHLMITAAALAPRAVLFAVRRGTLVGWAGAGLPTGLNPRALTAPLGGDGLPARAAARCAAVRQAGGDSGDDPLAARLGLPSSGEAVAAPLWIKSRVAAVLYADTGDEPPETTAWSPEGIEVTATLAALALESLHLRALGARPAPPPPARPTLRSRLPAESGSGATTSVSAAARGPVPAKARDASEDAAEAERRRLREEARRFAHLLATEVVLYNQQEIEEGRRSGDLYQRLKETFESE